MIDPTFPETCDEVRLFSGDIAVLCEVFGVILRCKMFTRICYPIFRGYQLVSPGF